MSDLFFKKSLITFKVMPEQQTYDKSQNSIDPILLNTLFFKRLFVVFDKKKNFFQLALRAFGAYFSGCISFSIGKSP